MGASRSLKKGIKDCVSQLAVYFQNGARARHSFAQPLSSFFPKHRILDSCHFSVHSRLRGKTVDPAEPTREKRPRHLARIDQNFIASRPRFSPESTSLEKFLDRIKYYRRKEREREREILQLCDCTLISLFSTSFPDASAEL